VRRELLTWRAEQWSNVAPGSVYSALKTLERDGLIEVVSTDQQGNRLARTVYRVTELLSGILLPMSLGPHWLYNLSRANPLAYVVDAARELFAGQLTTRPVALGFAVTLACAALATTAAVRTFRRESG
jgi:PadR family transcriptional regulator